MADKLAMILSDLSITKFIPVSMAVTKRAVSLTKHYGKQVYGYDAVHIATAIEYKAACFITNDKKLLSLKLQEIELRSI